MQMPVEKLCLETGNVLERFETAEVPEKKDNVDEMMMQFRGREEELVETLRSMQERQVAQKSRIEGQKRAKRDARAAVKNKYTDKTPLAVDNTGAPADENWMNEIDNTLGADGENSSSSFGRLGIEQLSSLLSKTPLVRHQGLFVLQKRPRRRQQSPQTPRSPPFRSAPFRRPRRNGCSDAWIFRCSASRSMESLRCGALK
jgi:hypothetical protein